MCIYYEHNSHTCVRRMFPARIFKSNRSLELITIVLLMCEKGYCLSFPFLSFETIDKKSLMFIFVYYATLKMIVNQKENIVKHRLPPLRFIFWPV